ncbi:MAG: cobalamin-dependent protein [Planctomycetes bacterium]|nr:cobalamin-dependent protein [Planctomycetota bacterium]
MTTTPAFAANLIRTALPAFASAVHARLESEAPELLAALPRTFAASKDDVRVRLLHLAAAIEFDRPALIEHAVQWYAVALHHRGVPADYLRHSLEAIDAVLAAELPAAARSIVHRHVRAAVAAIAGAELDPPACIDIDAPHGRLAASFLLAALESRGDDAVALIRQELDQGLAIAELHDRVLVPVLRETGRMWLTAEIQIADEHYSSQIVERVIWVAQDRLPRVPADAPVVLAMGAAGDQHGFGLRMIAQRLQGDGFAVHNLGPDMPAGDLAGALQDRAFDIVAVGATMTLHLHALAGLVEELRRLLRPGVPIVVGGQPFAIVPDLSARLGADAAAVDGGSASAVVSRLLGRPPRAGA